jgi:hypothetical protein
MLHMVASATATLAEPMARTVAGQSRGSLDESKSSMKKAATKARNVDAKPDEPSPDDVQALKAHRAARAGPRLKVSGSTVHVDYQASLKAVGSTDGDFLEGLLKQLVNVGSQGSVVDESGANFMLAVVKGIEPRDEIEAMLAAQMAAVHNATMTFARRLAHVENIPQQDSAQNAFNKLTRTFAAQVEALKRYRAAASKR